MNAKYRNQGALRPLPTDEGPQGLEGLQGGLRYIVYCRKSTEAEDRQVMSMPAQNDQIDRRFIEGEGLQIVDRVEEARSAKYPGRPVFEAVLARIDKGEADGIIAWSPDRLARNAVDGGRIIYLLDQGGLKDLKFCTCTFENNTQGKFMLQIAFAQSKHYSDNLSDVVKRGNAAKLARGWAPGGWRLGYKHDAATKSIVIDPDTFPILRQMFELVLTGAYRPAQVVQIADRDWGFRTPRRRKMGDRPISTSTFYRMLANPFYAGLIVWNGRTYHGNHRPLVTMDEFNRIQAVLGRNDRERPQKHEFAYTGLIRCGSCNLMVTAEHKVNRYGSRYVYYHCTKRRLPPRCPEPVIQVGKLEGQIASFLGDLTMLSTIEQAVLEFATSDQAEERERNEAKVRSLEATLRSIERQWPELTRLKLQGLFTDDEFRKERARLEQERIQTTKRLMELSQRSEWFEPLQELFLFSNKAVEWFSNAGDGDKRLIFQTAGSNPTLRAKILNVSARKPFIHLRDLTTIPNGLGYREDVRTFQPEASDIRCAIGKVLADPELPEILRNIRVLRDRFLPMQRTAASTWIGRTQ